VKISNHNVIAINRVGILANKSSRQRLPNFQCGFICRANPLSLKLKHKAHALLSEASHAGFEQQATNYNGQAHYSHEAISYS
jgi:hypothetical protein